MLPLPPVRSSRLAAGTALGALLLATSPTLARSQAVPPRDLAERQRLQRIETLADVWSKLELFHPTLQVRPELDWDRAFVRALPRVESAGTTADFVRVLNEELFAPLGDPLSFARTQDEMDRRHPSGVPGSALVRRLADGVAYVDLRFDPPAALLPAATLTTRIRDGLRQHRDSNASLDLIVVDLRWQTKYDPFGASVLGLWTGRPLVTGTRVSRMHRGFYQPVRWQVEPAATIQPVSPEGELPAVRTPTVFVVNPSSFVVLGRALDALQRLPGIAVALETTGPMHEGWEILTYPEMVRVRIDSPKLLSLDGSLGARADTVVGTPVSADALVPLARAALAAAARRPSRPPFTFPWRPLPRYPVDSAPIPRELRVLGLVRTWRELSLFSAYLPYARIDLPRALPAWIPQVERAASTREYYRTMRRLIALLDDSHAGVQHPTVNAPPWTIPALLQRAGAHVLVMRVDSSLKAGELAVGDEILAVDGVPARAVEDSLRIYRSASHPGPHARNVWDYAEGVRGPRDTPVRLTVRGPRGRREVTLRRSVDWRAMAIVPPHRDSIVRRLPGNVGYIAMNGLASEGMLDSALTTLADTDALVLDMRRNLPAWFGGTNPDIRNLLVSRFLTEPVTEPKGGIHAVYMHGGPPVRAYEEQEMQYVPYANAQGIRYAKPIAVLIGPRNQSALESAMWQLRLSKRATFVGEATAGTNGGAPDFTIPGGGFVIFTHERVTYPGNGRFHGIGIVPDVPVVPTPAGVRAGRDEVLERAVVVLRGRAGRR